MAYVTEEEVEADLQQDFTTTSSPTSSTVDDWINRATNEIDLGVGHTFTTTSIDDVYIATEGGPEVWIPTKYTPIVSMDTVELNTGTDWDETLVAKTEGTDYIVVNEKRLSFPPTLAISRKQHGLKIGTLVYGYETTPELVKKLALKIIAKKYVNYKLTDTNATLTQEIRVGPITLKNSSGEVSKFLDSTTQDIDELYSKLGTFNTYFY